MKLGNVCVRLARKRSDRFTFWVVADDGNLDDKDEDDESEDDEVASPDVADEREAKV